MRIYTSVFITLFIAMILALLPMPAALSWARPAWVLLVLIFWGMRQPYTVNVGFAWLAGFYLDIISGTMIGEHALAMTAVIYLVCRFHHRLNMYTLLQQALSVMMFVLLYQAIIYCIQGFVGEQPLSWSYWLSTLTSAILWPWLAVILSDYSRWLSLDLAK